MIEFFSEFAVTAVTIDWHSLQGTLKIHMKTLLIFFTFLQESPLEFSLDKKH